MSEDFGSGESTNEEQEMDSSQKSPCPEEKSPHSSSSSTHADDEGDSPNNSSVVGGGGVASSSGDAPRAERVTRAPSPQQFMRVSKDLESTCARTDLVYIHPPASEKELASSTTKVHSNSR
jgi:hypothetical protein